MMLSDMGADVVRIERRRDSSDNRPLDLFNPGKFGVLDRGRRSVALDLKEANDLEVALRLVAKADGLLEGFRPGVMEKLGLGPDVCLERNPKLVYGRMTGWGQHGTLAHAAGHDLNYIALTGALHAMGRADEVPPVPLNLVGDFGGGGMMLAFGMVCGLLEAGRSGRGQVIDAAMTDGAALLMSMVYGMKEMDMWSNRRESNLLDGGAHFYGCYECADGKYVAVGALEPHFYRELLERAGIDDPDIAQQFDPEQWPRLKEKLAEIFRTKNRDQWCELLEGTDGCFAPVLDLEEAPAHPHNVARETFTQVEGVAQPAPAPRFSRTPAHIQGPPAASGQHTEEVLAEWGITKAQK
jgi:alpha-methylacyl-CoA racemase